MFFFFSLLTLWLLILCFTITITTKQTLKTNNKWWTTTICHKQRTMTNNECNRAQETSTDARRQCRHAIIVMLLNMFFLVLSSNWLSYLDLGIFHLNTAAHPPCYVEFVLEHSPSVSVRLRLFPSVLRPSITFFPTILSFSVPFRPIRVRVMFPLFPSHPFQPSTLGSDPFSVSSDLAL